MSVTATLPPLSLYGVTHPHYYPLPQENHGFSMSAFRPSEPQPMLHQHGPDGSHAHRDYACLNTRNVHNCLGSWEEDECLYAFQLRATAVWPSPTLRSTELAGPSYSACPTPAWPPLSAAPPTMCERYHARCGCPLCTAERIRLLEDEERERGTPVRQEIDERDMEDVAHFLLKDDEERDEAMAREIGVLRQYGEYDSDGEDVHASDEARLRPADVPVPAPRPASASSDMSMSSESSLFARHERSLSNDTTFTSDSSFALSESAQHHDAGATTPMPEQC
ncbi:hypothetical protein AURDEDRAFT_118275 [Auricularia subglabra TFB-10046 SS5]|nr:hypothetical protein AURDEDRAFT_118275 [Auricularia subglabra TFB-10046 SS5]